MNIRITAIYLLAYLCSIILLFDSFPSKQAWAILAIASMSVVIGGMVVRGKE